MGERWNWNEFETIPEIQLFLQEYQRGTHSNFRKSFWKNLIFDDCHVDIFNKLLGRGLESYEKVRKA